ncbi:MULTISPECIES: beta-class carbonic anhydrase [Heyndrickxia]|uniref:beta-class carbonic anhydrase n=1 Tax=Heyndrickxia TaxID=2837504 RepID=UPI001B10A909|nr:carbonic anhydrase [Heyndrickxia oleronia]GIN39089.1 putative carbonic anhydrase YtiB [Heyndrickxia oleronia]
MTLLNDILSYNEEFVSQKKYRDFTTTKYPDKRLVILTCMDTRLVELLHKATNTKNGDVKIIKNAGAIVTHPFGSIMRSLLIAVYELQADEVLVIGHHDCGMSAINSNSVLEKLKQRGIEEQTLETIKYSGIDLHEWFQGFDHVEDSVKHSVDMIKHHPLMSKDIPIHGLVIDPETGKLDLVVNGYEN